MNIVKNQNTFAKRAREMEKKRKSEEKRNRRKERKAAESESSQDMPNGEPFAQSAIENQPADDNS